MFWNKKKKQKEGITEKQWMKALSDKELAKIKDGELEPKTE